jgi:hypothetical protein
MVQVVAADGSSAVYQYDSAGNITAIQRLTATQLALTAFNPTGGGPGTQVTLQGGGFSTTPGMNGVSFNGAAASVLAATANQLLVQVPTGATSGPISVTVGSQTVTSSQPFLILPLPKITGFSPTSGVVGTMVTLTGINLNPVPGQTTLTVNGLHVPISSSADQQITFQVPPDVGSGSITVTTAYGRVTTSTILTVTPPDVDPGSVVLTSTLAANGSARAVNLSRTGKYALFTFQGRQGDYPSLQLSSFTSSDNSLHYSLYDRTNTVIRSDVLWPEKASAHLPRLSATGTYSVAFFSGSGTDQFSVSLEMDPAAAVDGVSLNVASATYGQSKRFVFVVAKAANIGLGVSNLVNQIGDDAWVSVYRPSGGTVSGAASETCQLATGCDLALTNLPETGVYEVVVESPDASNALSYTATVSNDVAVPLTAGTPASVSLTRIGQHGRLTFSGTAGAAAGLQLVMPSTTPSGRPVDITVYNPDGTTLVSDGGYGGDAFQIPSLATTGTYSILIDPRYGATANLTARLVTAAGGAVPVDGTAHTITGGTYSYFGFSAAAGANIDIAIGNLVKQNGSSDYDYVDVYVYNPDGTSQGNSRCYVATGCHQTLTNAPMTGLYGVVVESTNPSDEPGLVLSYTATCR